LKEEKRNEYSEQEQEHGFSDFHGAGGFKLVFHGFHDFEAWKVEGPSRLSSLKFDRLG